MLCFGQGPCTQCSTFLILSFLLPKQMAKFATSRLKALSHWHIIPSGHSTILEIDAVASVNIDYLPTQYCLDRGFHFLIPSEDNCDPNTVVHSELLDIYTDSSKLNDGVRSGIYSGISDLSISLRLPDYCTVFQTKVMVIYLPAQWILVNRASFTSV